MVYSFALATTNRSNYPNTHGHYIHLRNQQHPNPTPPPTISTESPNHSAFNRPLCISPWAVATSRNEHGIIPPPVSDSWDIEIVLTPSFLPLPSSPPARTGERHDEFDFEGEEEGASVFHGLLLPPLSLSFPSCTRYIHMQIYSASVRAPAYYAYTRGSAGPSRACCRCSGEGHKLNDVNALSTLCRRGETTHELSLSLLLSTPTASHVSPSHSHRYIGPRVTSTIHANPWPDPFWLIIIIGAYPAARFAWMRRKDNARVLLIRMRLTAVELPKCSPRASLRWLWFGYISQCYISCICVVVFS